MYTIAQTFLVDPGTIGGATEAALTSVALYFRKKPARTNNISGIVAPGATIAIAEVNGEVPNAQYVLRGSQSNVLYDTIVASTDASVPTDFIFNEPILVKAGRSYAILIGFDGDEEFDLWLNRSGDRIVGTNTPSPGAAGKNDGKYFSLSTGGTWRPSPDIDLKFRARCAQYTANSYTIELVNKNYEFFTVANVSGKFQGGEYVYQKTGYIDGTAAVNSTSTTVTGTGTSFTGISESPYVVISDGTSGNTDVRRVTTVANDTIMTVDEPLSFTNSAAFVHNTPVGVIYYTDYGSNKIYLSDSSANATMTQNNTVYFRFITDGVNDITISAGGTGHSNSDVLTLSSGGSTLNATATVTTNTTGGIVTLNISNNGLGFTSTPTQTGLSGSGETLVANLGSVIIGSDSGSYADISSIDDFSVQQFTPDIYVGTPPGTTVNITRNYAFQNTTSSFEVNGSNEKQMHTGVPNTLKYDADILSRSREVLSSWRDALHANSKSAIIKLNFDVLFDSDFNFTTPVLDCEKMDVFVYDSDINNDATAEQTTYGNAISKHITTKIKFAEDRFAEDIRVYAKMYRPSTTDVQIYARVHNSQDPEAFDDRLWTPLTIIEGANSFSATGNENDLVEIGYGFPKYPETANTLDGFATTELSNTEIVGIGTDFNTALAANDVVKVYSTLFPDNYQVRVVDTVTNATHFTVTEAISNNNVVGSGLKVDELTYEFTAFNNITNDNVVRYYSKSLVAYDTYDSMALKIVLLANTNSIAPHVEDIRAVGVSA